MCCGRARRAYTTYKFNGATWKTKKQESRKNVYKLFVSSLSYGSSPHVSCQWVYHIHAYTCMPFGRLNHTLQWCFCYHPLPFTSCPHSAILFCWIILSLDAFMALLNFFWSLRNEFRGIPGEYCCLLDMCFALCFHILGVRSKWEWVFCFSNNSKHT